jgi:hypothetical protein
LPSWRCLKSRGETRLTNPWLFLVHVLDAVSSTAQTPNHEVQNSKPASIEPKRTGRMATGRLAHLLASECLPQALLWAQEAHTAQSINPNIGPGVTDMAAVSLVPCSTVSKHYCSFTICPPSLLQECWTRACRQNAFNLLIPW